MFSLRQEKLEHAVGSEGNCRERSGGQRDGGDVFSRSEEGVDCRALEGT